VYCTSLLACNNATGLVLGFAVRCTLSACCGTYVSFSSLGIFVRLAICFCSCAVLTLSNLFFSCACSAYFMHVHNFSSVASLMNCTSRFIIFSVLFIVSVCIMFRSVRFLIFGFFLLFLTASRINVILPSWSKVIPFDFRMFFDLGPYRHAVNLSLGSLPFELVLNQSEHKHMCEIPTGSVHLSGCVVIVFFCVKDFGGLINVIINFCLGSSLVICNAWMCFKDTHLDCAFVWASVVVLVVMSSLFLFVCYGFFGVEVLCLFY
jgi:hypothetical protein